MKLLNLKKNLKNLAGVAAVAVCAISMPASAQDLTEAMAQAAGVPQIDAFLPYKYDVPESAASPIDGVWTVNTIRKRIQIENGRAYAVDPWLHMFTLKVQKDMVVLRDIQRTGAGEYAAYDLPLLGDATFKLMSDGNMRVTVKGALSPVSYTLIKREVADATAFQNELYAMANGGVIPPPVAPVPPVTTSTPDEKDPLADCVKLDMDPQTGDIICLD